MAPHANADRAFDQYIANFEKTLARQHSAAASFLPVPDRFRRGELLLESEVSGGKVPGGMIHHWRGTRFVPGATAADFLRVVQDVNRFSIDYAPQVMRARLVSQTGDRFKVEMRLRYRKVVTVTLDTTYDIDYGSLDPAHGYSLSRSTRISEIANPDTPEEHALKPGEDHGFLWRLNSYWSYQQEADGLLLQCEAVSLTRDIPFGMDWAVGPFVLSIPRESLEFTLNATRNALVSRRNHGH